MRSRLQVLRDAKDGLIEAPVRRPTRRTFIQASAAAGGGLLLSWRTARAAAPQMTSAAGAAMFHPHAFIRIDPDDVVTVWCAQPDMGEGTRTALPMLLVDELDADWPRVRVESAPLDRERYGPQGVGGSDAINSDWDRLRQLGAVARLMLVRAAAALWNVGDTECTTQAGVVRHEASGRKATYGELASRAAALPVPDRAPLKDPSEYRLIGTRVASVDAHAIATGQPLFGIDVRMPGMKFAAIAKSPRFGGRPLKIDGARALQVPGVRQIVPVHGLDNPIFLMPGVAVVADSTWAAFKGREALVVEWTEDDVAAESSDTLKAQAQTLIEKPPLTVYDSGGVDEALEAAAVRVDNVFSAAFVAHATLEPHNCTADYRDGEVWIRGPLQVPGSAAQVVARALGIPAARVHVHATRIGGGFGRRLMSDCAAEAAVVSRAVGAPVQVIDSRTGDLQHDYFRPLSVQRLRAGLDANGHIVAWDHVLVSTSRNAYRRDSRPPYSTETYGSYVGRFATPDYTNLDLIPARIAHARLRYAALRTNVPTGAWRAPAHVANAFTIESTIDELASMARRSAVDMRLELLGETADIPVPPDDPAPYDPARMAHVIRVAAERGGLGGPMPEGRGRGIAAHYTFGGYCAQVVEASVDDRKRVAIHRITAVVDVGQQVNVLGIEAQVQGGIIDALGSAFFGDVPIRAGRAAVTNFNDYRLIRNREIPAVIDVVIVQSTRHPTGVGEIPVPVVAPAVVNAIAAATGERLRQMPFAGAGYELRR